MDFVQCKGSEAELVQCEQNDWGDNQCRHTEDAGVRCEGSMSVGKSLSFNTSTFNFNITKAYRFHRNQNVTV